MKEPIYSFQTILNKDEIKKRVVGQKAGWLSEGLCGYAYGNQLIIRYKTSYNNSFIPVFYGKINENDNVALITGSFKMFPVVKAFIWFWRATILLLSVAILTSPLWADHSESNSYLLVLIPIAMIAFSFILEHIGFRLGRSGRLKVIEFIKNELLAQAI